MGVVAATGSLLALGAPAFAAGPHKPANNPGNQNTVNLLPINICDDNIALLGLDLPLGSPQSGDCAAGVNVGH